MILITGANGQLGYDFQRLFDEIKEEYIATDVKDLDIINIEKVREFVKDKNITLIINCAAYNNVDKAEDEPEFCKKLNTYAPRDLAIVANEIDADYITYSTDFVFDGKKKTPYTEEAIPNPLSVYGKTKLEGEKEVFRVKSNSFVVRTSWVFGVANNNFNKQVINWSKTNDELSIVDDQISSPTYSRDLAYYSWELIKTKKYGLYHLSNDGEASKYDQAKYVLDKIGWQGKLNRAKTKDFNLKAERAEYTKLDNSKLEKVINQKIPSWQDGIDRFLKENNKELVTIIVPTYRNFNNLDKNLLSIFNQTYNNIELIISDDGSENYDESLIDNIIEKYKNLNKNLKIKKIHHLKNIGTVKNANYAIKNSTGKYIFFLAQDDIFYNEKVVEEIINNFGENLICTTYRNCLSEEEFIEVLPNKERLEKLNTKNSYLDLLVNGNYISGACTYYKKEVFEKYGYFDEKMRLLEDFPYYLEILRNKEKIGFIPIKSINYFLGGISTTKKINLVLLEDFKHTYLREVENAKGYLKRILKFNIKITENILLSENPKKCYLSYPDIAIIKVINKLFKINLYNFLIKIKIIHL